MCIQVMYGGLLRMTHACLHDNNTQNSDLTAFKAIVGPQERWYAAHILRMGKNRDLEIITCNNHWHNILLEKSMPIRTMLLHAHCD